MNELQKIMKEYTSFLGQDSSIYFAPGRVNIIGEHIDYLGGHVFPMAISLGTYGFVSKRQDKSIRLLSHNFKDFGYKEVSLEDLTYKEEDNWTNYAKGVFYEIIQRGHEIPHGLNIVIYGTLPNGSGLSSSASLEVLIAYIIKDIYQVDISLQEIALLCKKVENEYIGVNSGIMDQFSIAMAEKNKAIHLNTETLEYQQVPFELDGYQVLIANTNKKRSLSEGAYNTRVSECKHALDLIQDKYPITQICQIKEEDLKDVEGLLESPYKNRVRHAVTEQARTQKTLMALVHNEVDTIGNLLTQSHQSLRDDYQVSCKELDTIVKLFLDKGAVGARMTGAGFGGCAIAIVEKSKVDNILEDIKKEYKNIIGYDCDIYPVVSSSGPHKINKEDLV